MSSNPIENDEIPRRPHLAAKALETFERLATGSKCYLEYGCGGSTIFAADELDVASVVSVESDPRWHHAVLNTVRRKPGPGFHLEHCDIGPVGNWGAPKDRGRIKDFWQYMFTPWEICRQNTLAPDFVFVDGRFRVASFLYSLICAAPDTAIMFDDYTERPNYHIVEKFCALKSTAATAAIFCRPQELDIPEITATLARYSIIPE